MGKRPQFIPEVSASQRVLQILDLGDVVREEGTGTWYIGDGVTFGGVSGGPPTQAALANILTGGDVYADYPQTNAPLLVQQVSDMQTAQRIVITRLYEMFGEDFIQSSDTLAQLIIDGNNTF